MQTLLLLLHTDTHGSLDHSSRQAVTAARDLKSQISGAQLVAGLVGKIVDAAAGELATAGVDRFLGVSGEDFASPRYATDTAAAAALVRESGAEIVLAPGTSRWSRCLPGTAYRVGGNVDTQVTALQVSDGQLEITRWFYRQRIETRLSRSRRPWILVVAAGTQIPWHGEPGHSIVEPVTVDLADTDRHTEFVGLQSLPQAAQTIRPEANLLFVAGAGWTKKQADGQVHLEEAEFSIREILRNTGASLGSSKSLVDLGGEGQAVLSFLSHMNQIGQTGATPRHPKGLATCCHGEEPHTIGWRFIQSRRAVNLDANCGWAHGKADVLYIADAFAVVREMNALLAASPPTRETPA